MNLAIIGQELERIYVHLLTVKFNIQAQLAMFQDYHCVRVGVIHSSLPT